MVGAHGRAAHAMVAALLAVLVGVPAASQWNNWILFRNPVAFGVSDPQFQKDVSFYVFTLPFVSFLVNWLFVAIVIIAVVTVIAHYLNGGVRFRASGNLVTSPVKAHMSVLLGCLALTKAVGYFLARYELNFSTRGVVNGATYTDVNAQLPALTLLILISLLAVALFLYNIRLQGWVLPGVAVGLWAFTSVVVGGLYPALIQRFKVEPAENKRERPYIVRNIEATRTALDLARVEGSPFDYSENLTAADLQDNAATIRNVRLWDPQFVKATYQKLQEIRSYYRFNEVAIDRYAIDGKLTQTIVSARELNAADLPSQSWVNRHLQFTHGYGALLAPANAVTQDGKPDFLLRDIPPVATGVPPITQPRIYYGRATGGYAIVRSGQKEIDFQRPDGTSQESTYAGRGGVSIGSFLRRMAIALRFGDPNVLISNYITSDSRALYLRDIGSRVRTAAPFLRYDADPYPVILGGRVVWIQDAYTTTARYPYAQPSDAQLPEGSGLLRRLNYVRNSVKVAVDAYDGTMTFFLVDRHDPIARVYAKAFPGLFTPASKMSPELRAHLRYPEDLFRVQTTMYGRYHITDPNDFYNASDAWKVSQDPGSGSPTAALRLTQSTGAQGSAVAANTLRRMDPAYLLMRLPNEQTESFLILRPFVPASQGDKQQNMTAFMTASSDPEDYGKLQVFVMPRGRQIDGPLLVDSRVAAEAEISKEITLLNQQGSEVLLGNVLVLPVDQSILYVRPLYVQSQRNPLPEFKKAILVFGNTAVMRDTFRDALSAVFGSAPPTLEQQAQGQIPGQGAGTATGTVTASVHDLLDRALAAHDAARAALQAGDFPEFGRQLMKEQELLRRARQVVAGPLSPAGQ
jgi:uncharacterized membrane protein (UPF0182 family)